MSLTLNTWILVGRKHEPCLVLLPYLNLKTWEFAWPGLTVKPGSGLVVTSPLSRYTLIPILKSKARLTRHGVGANGLCIADLAAETQTPNAVPLRSGFLMLTRALDPGQAVQVGDSKVNVVHPNLGRYLASWKQLIRSS